MILSKLFSRSRKTKETVPEPDLDKAKKDFEAKIEEYQSKLSMLEKNRQDWEEGRKRETREFMSFMQELEDQKRQVTVKDISINKVTLTEAWLDGFNIGFEKGWETAKGDIEKIRDRIRTEAINDTLKRLNKGLNNGNLFQKS